MTTRNAPTFAAALQRWAGTVPEVKALVLIGSRARPPQDALWAPAPDSDWDFQIITSQPGLFADRAWAQALRGQKLRAYAARSTRIGTLPKVNLVFERATADATIIPEGLATASRQGLARGQHRAEPGFYRALQDLAVVVRPGWRFLKGAEEWEAFYRDVVAQIDDPRLDDAAVAQLAEGFVCDYVACRQKVARGELTFAQRWLHRELAEVNFQLWHELRLRQGRRTFPEARRLERVGSPAEVARIAVSARRNRAELRRELEKAKRACVRTVAGLLGSQWSWPKGV